MTYLRSLASRIVRPDGAIRPRLPGLFEPVATLGETGYDWPDKVDAPPAPTVEWANGPGEWANGPGRPLDASDVEEPGPMKSIPQQAQRTVLNRGSALPLVPAPPAPAATRAPEPAGRARASTPSLSGRQPAQQPQRQPQQPAQRRVPEPGRVEIRVEYPELPGAGPASPGVTAEPASAAPDATPLRPANPAPTRWARSEPISPAAQLVTRRDRLAPELHRQSAPAPPTVNVTIGRVEVRATPAPVASPRSQPDRRPTMSLAEYLQGREARR